MMSSERAGEKCADLLLSDFCINQWSERVSPWPRYYL